MVHNDEVFIVFFAPENAASRTRTMRLFLFFGGDVAQNDLSTSWSMVRTPQAVSTTLATLTMPKGSRGRNRSSLELDGNTRFLTRHDMRTQPYY